MSSAVLFLLDLASALLLVLLCLLLLLGCLVVVAYAVRVVTAEPRRSLQALDECAARRTPPAEPTMPTGLVHPRSVPEQPTGEEQP